MLCRSQQYTLLLLLVMTASIIICASDQNKDQEARIEVMNQIAHTFSSQGYTCLYAQSRNIYAANITSDVKAGPATSCPFCTEIAAENDEMYFILKRGRNMVVTLNPYPYIAGHMMVIPYAHKGQLRELTQEARAEWAELVTLATSALKDAYDCPGVQMGSNFGECAGASIPGHLHTHVIPTSKGHQAFINILGNTVVITKDLPTVYKELKPYFEEESNDQTAS